MQLIPALQRQRFAATRAVLSGGPGQFRPKKNPPGLIKKIGSFLSLLFIISALGVGAVTFGPNLYFRFFPAETVPVVSEDKFSPLGGSFDQGAAAVNTASKYTPPRDESLPDGEWVIIPRIGVRTQLLKTASSATALEKGVWWVPDFGNPGDDKPMILVAHRFGYKWWWQSDYWKYHSFYLLPELQPGDLIEVIADKRKWVYEVYAGEENEEISDYQADLILYTCKYLNSTVRHFRYARLVNPDVDTQKMSAQAN